MNPKRLHNFTLIPVFILGLTFLTIGFGWLLSPEPWLLDQTANEALLNVSFAELFSKPINRSLPDYLSLAYRFFGWWVISIGMLILAYAIVTRMGTSMARGFIHFVLLVMLIGLTIIEIMFIPLSPFLYFTWGAWSLWLISFYSGFQIQKYDA